MTPRYRPDPTCSAHPGRECRAVHCVICGRHSTPVSGLLGTLYPGSTTCDGCGRRQLHCSCARDVAVFDGGEVA